MKIESKSFALKNGFEVIRVDDKNKPTVSAQLFVRVGSNWENLQSAGYCHLVEHLVFKSTPKYPNNTAMKVVAQYGGEINAFTDYETTCYYININSEFLDIALSVLSEIVFFANFSDFEFQVERDVVIQELFQYENDPEDQFLSKLCDSFFKKSPYKKPIIGNLASLKNATLDSVANFYKNNYCPSNSFLVVSGGIKLSNKQISTYFDRLDSSKKVIRQKVTDRLESRFAKFTYLPSRFNKPRVALCLVSPSEREKDSVAFDIALKMIAGGKNSILYKHLFIEKKLISSMQLFSFRAIRKGATFIELIPRDDRVNDLIQNALDEIEKAKMFNLLESDFALAKKEMYHSYKFSFEHPESLAFALGNEHLLGSFKDYLNIGDRIKATTFDEISTILKKYLSEIGFFVFAKNQVDFTPKPPTIKKLLTRRDFQQLTLQQGFQLLVKSIKHNPTIGITLCISVGSTNEDTKHLGINNLTTNSLVFGTKKRNLYQMSEFCAQNGIILSVSSTSSLTTINLKLFPKSLFLAIGLLKELLFEPQFPSIHIANMRSTTISQLSMEKDDPISYSDKVFYQMLLGKTNNITNSFGTKTSLKSLSRRGVSIWHKDLLLQGKKVLTIVGDINIEKTIDFCQNIFGAWQAQERTITYQPTFKPNTKKRHRKNIGIKNQRIIHIGGFGPKMEKVKEVVAFSALTQIIGGSICSRMFKQLREELGICYSANFAFAATPFLGFFAAKTMVEKTSEQTAIKSIMTIFKQIKTDGVLDEELHSAKNYMLFQKKNLQGDSLSISNAIASLICMGYDYNFYLGGEKRIKEVNKSIVIEVAREYLNNFSQLVCE